MQEKQRIIDLIEEKKQIFFDASDKIWEHAEIRFDVPKSASILMDILEKEDFTVEKNIAHMEHAFIGTYGSGEPIIGILAEYDALTNLSQVADLPKKEFLDENGNGHGCGHNALGSGAVAGAVGIKDFMKEENLKGTIKVFGCPAEESGYGKAFMAREGVFDDLDTVLTWHPLDVSSAWTTTTLAVYQVYFNFKGVSSHAAAAPEHGRSALDAAELMNIGANFLREHVIDSARIHYAFMDVGGQSANVVQPTASLHYFIRAPKTSQVHEIYERLVKVAKGAAMMTETEVEMVWDSACAEYIPNKALTKAMYENLKMTLPKFTEEEKDYQREFFNTLSESERERLDNKPLNEDLLPLEFKGEQSGGSTDVGDASWIAPTAQVTVASYPHGTNAHSWQWVATGKSSVVHKGLLSAGKTIALTAYDVLTNPDLLVEAKEEHIENLGGESYKSAIPKDVLPR